MIGGGVFNLLDVGLSVDALYEYVLSKDFASRLHELRR